MSSLAATVTGVVRPQKPDWEFSRSANLTWAWRSIAKDERANSFISLNEATADATKHGFDPFCQYWIARNDGRTTHFRPGKPPLNLPATEEPKD